MTHTVNPKSTRAALPNRRPSRTVEAEWQGIPFSVTIGLHPSTAAPMEVFADTPKGGHMQATIADACVIVSIALQHGIPPEALAKSLSRVPELFTDGDLPGSPIGVIVGAITDTGRGA
jgi:hypothetical protein